MFKFPIAVAASILASFQALTSLELSIPKTTCEGLFRRTQPRILLQCPLYYLVLSVYQVCSCERHLFFKNERIGG